MADESSRSPSPADAPPIASAPGPRAAKLIKLYEEAINHTLATCNYGNFSSCFPTAARNVPEALEGLHRDFIDRLGSQCRSEFDLTLQERNVIPCLNDLDRLVEEARKRRAKAQAENNGGPVQSPVPPHTLPARSLYLASLQPTIRERQSALQERLQHIQDENAELLERLTAQRAEINEMVGSVEKVVQDISSSLDALSSEDVQALTKTTLEVDAEMRAAD